jgi:hypothetical protein
VIEQRLESLSFVMLYSAIRTLHSAIEEGGDLMLWVINGPERGSFRIQSLKFKVESKSNSLDFWEEKHGQDH